MAFTLQQLADRIGARIEGDGSVKVTGCAPIDIATSDQITFLANAKYLRNLETTQAAAVLIDTKTTCPGHLNRLVCDDPYFAFRNLMIELHGFRRHPLPSDDYLAGVSSQAIIHPEATISEGAVIHPFAVVECGATIGNNTVLYPGVFVGPEARVGNDCILYPNVVIYDYCTLGNRVTLHSNTVIGQDGFGYATHSGAHHKIPQTGIVVIEDDVELGAGCAIERSTMGETRIGKGTKFADLISIGHGTTIGNHCLFVSLCGISGSVDVGNYVVIGGQVGVVGHLRIGDGVQVMARSGVASDVPDGAKVGGAPAVPYTTAKKNALAGASLYELVKRVRKLEREIDFLKADHKT